MTQRQSDCLDAIEAEVARTGRMPLFKVLAHRLGLQGRGGNTHRLVASLERDGYLRREQKVTITRSPS